MALNHSACVFENPYKITYSLKNFGQKLTSQLKKSGPGSTIAKPLHNFPRGRNAQDYQFRVDLLLDKRMLMATFHMIKGQDGRELEFRASFLDADGRKRYTDGMF